jgi:hypothetical protein
MKSTGIPNTSMGSITSASRAVENPCKARRR